MKTIILLLLNKRNLGLGLVFLFAGTLQAQELSLTEDRARTEDTQDIEAWTAVLDQPEDYTRDTFDKFIKQEFSLRTEKRAKNILAVPKAKIVEIMSLRGDLRAIFTPRGSGTAVSLSFSPGYDIHVNKATYPDEYTRLSGIAKRYVKFHYTNYYQDLLKDTEKALRNKQKDIEKNQSRISRLKTDIAENEAKINAGDKNTPKLTDKNRKAQENISTMESELTTWQAEVTQLRETLDRAQTSMKKVTDY
jgi:ribosomal protein S20